MTHSSSYQSNTPLSDISNIETDVTDSRQMTGIADINREHQNNDKVNKEKGTATSKFQAFLRSRNSGDNNINHVLFNQYNGKTHQKTTANAYSNINAKNKQCIVNVNASADNIVTSNPDFLHANDHFDVDKHKHIDNSQQSNNAGELASNNESKKNGSSETTHLNFNKSSFNMEFNVDTKLKASSRMDANSSASVVFTQASQSLHQALKLIRNHSKNIDSASTSSSLSV
jgi:hypothetical protein